MTDRNYTHLLLIVDRSGSMMSIAPDMNGGIAKLLEDQALEPGSIVVDAWTFDSVVEHVAVSAEPTDDRLQNLVDPRGSTALLDAIGLAVNDLGSHFAAIDESRRPSKVVVAIVTDGEENASHEYTTEQVKAIVAEQQEKYGWQFLFLGANIDAFDVAGSFGIPQSNAINYAPAAAGAANVFASTSGLLREYRGGVSASIGGYTDDDRKGSMQR